MPPPIWKIGCVVAFVASNLLALAVARYEDLGNLCLAGTTDQKYISTQAEITYSATPYPIVANTTNVTLTCIGRSVHPDFVDLDDLSYITGVEFYKNNILFHMCNKESFMNLRRLSCNVSVSRLTNDDAFWCIIRASNAPCNIAQISFQIQSPAAPTVSRLVPTFKYDAETVEVTCIGSGFPEPSVAWLLNGSTINRSSERNMTSTMVFTKQADVQNGTNVYRVNSKIIITGKTFPLRIQCVAGNDVSKVYSENVFLLYVEATVSKLRIATLRWMEYPHRNGSLHSSSGYNVSLQCGGECFETTGLYNKSGVTFHQLTMDRVYTVKVKATSKTGELIVGATSFYSPAMLPKPDSIYLRRLTSRKALICWGNVSANASIHGVLLGYKFTISGKNKNENITLPLDTNEILVSHLIRKSEYRVRLLGFSQYGVGSILEYNFTTLDIVPAPKNVKITSAMANFVVVQWTVVEQKQKKHDMVTGYTVTVINQTYSFHAKTSRDVSSVSINNLQPNSSYSVSVVGLSEETEGRPSEWIRFKTSDARDQPPTTNTPGDDRNKTKKDKSKSLVLITVVSVALVTGAIILLIALAIIVLRKRNRATKTYIVKTNLNLKQIEILG